ncbi:uncharacterized protein [Lolium perenne]|uniref:uncharacterized protein n=1 Tax=Lolium perenne TaxID=4522 RepID=UPI0021F657A8|nr:uncharacterized protein LOC127320004 [Lolium perenne]XP_051205755.1 uncharacterized protein LOC127320004 [Lolium perenne]
MLPLLRGVVSGHLRRSLSTAAPRPPWVLMDRDTQLTRSPVGVSSSFRPPPSASSITVPVWSLDLQPPGAGDNNLYMDTMRSRLLAASAHGFLLLDAHKSRFKLHPKADLNLPPDVLLKVTPSELVCRRFERRVCNPVTGDLFRLPDLHGTSTDGMGLLTQPERYVAAQLTEVDGGRRFMLRRFSSETGDWGELVLPSPLPPGRRMHLDQEHEVLDFGGRLWWVDLSWGAVCVDPFGARPELRAVELPEGCVLPGQHSDTDIRRLVNLKHRRMGVSAGRLCYADADAFHIRSFTLDDESGRWTLQHQVPVDSLWPNGKVLPSVAAIDPLDADVLHLNVEEFTVSVDMRQETILVGSASLLRGVSPQSASSSYLPCVLPSFLGSAPIPGKNDVEKNKTLADVLVRSDRHLKT